MTKIIDMDAKRRERDCGMSSDREDVAIFAAWSVGSGFGNGDPKVGTFTSEVGPAVNIGSLTDAGHALSRARRPVFRKLLKGQQGKPWLVLRDFSKKTADRVA